MKIIPIILYILFSSGFVAKSNNSDLDTVYLEGRKSQHFYIDFQTIINGRRRHTLDVLMDNDPKHRDAFYVIDQMIDNNVNPESIVKRILQVGVRRDSYQDTRCSFSSK